MYMRFNDLNKQTRHYRTGTSKQSKNNTLSVTDVSLPENVNSELDEITKVR